MSTAVAVVPIIIVCFVALVVVVYAYFPKIRGLHYTSLLVCPKCGHHFEYGWLPGGSLDSIRWGRYRLIRCQSCGRSSWYDIWSTRLPE